MRVYMCVCACGRRFGIAVLADVRYISRISIRNIIHVCRTPIHFHSVYSPSYVYTYIYIYTYIYAVRDEEKKAVELTRERG